LGIFGDVVLEGGAEGQVVGVGVGDAFPRCQWWDGFVGIVLVGFLVGGLGSRLAGTGFWTLVGGGDAEEHLGQFGRGSFYLYLVSVYQEYGFHGGTGWLLDDCWMMDVKK